MLVALMCLPLSMRGQDTVTISSASDWVSLCENYSGKEVNVRLGCDLILSDASKSMDDFRGTFDGQGHTLTVNYAKSSDVKAPFMKAQGTIKNLRIAGSVNLEGKEQSPLVYQVEQNATLAIESCSNEVDIQTGLGADGKNCSGGYICRLEGTATFEDCSYIGKIAFYFISGQQEETIHQCFTICGGEQLCMNECMAGMANYYLNDSGGYVGYVGSSSNIFFTNCYSSPLYTLDKKKGYSSYFTSENGWFVGCLESGSTTIGMTNCYYYPRKTSNVPSFSSTNFDIVAHSAEKVTEEQLTSGELAMKLKGSTTGAACAWGQFLGTDTLPQVRAVSPKSLEVFHVSKSARGLSLNRWYSFFWPFDATIPEGTEKYVVYAINEDEQKVCVSPYFGSATAHVPLLLKHTSTSVESIYLPDGYYNRQPQETLLRGAYEAMEASDDCRVIDYDGKFTKPSSKIAAGECYLTGVSADSYTLDISDVPICYINSTDEWNAFCKNYSGKEVKLYLGADITVTNNDEQCSSFIGTFDGQGHCLTLPTKKTLCDYAEGTIKNLKVYSNCQGVFAYKESSDAELHFADIFSDSPLIYDAKGTLTYSNVLYLFPESSNQDNMVIYRKDGDVQEYDMDLTDEKLASGEIAYKLNAGRTGDDIVWMQTIGVDAMPQLLSSKSKEVFQQQHTVAADAGRHWTTLYFKGDVTLPDSVMQYTVSDVTDSLVCLDWYPSSTVKAGTPVLLYAAKGMPELSLTAYYNETPTPKNGPLVGVMEETAAEGQFRILSETNGTATFTKPAEGASIPAWQCFLYANDYDTYVTGITGMHITSKADWNTFQLKLYYATEKFNCLLDTDLTLDQDIDPLSYFKGTFDGQGHTITISNSGIEDGNWAPFLTAQGTIRNLKIAGSLYSTGSNYDYHYAGAPLVHTVEGGTLNIENCQTDIMYDLPDEDKKYYNLSGFVHTVSDGATVNFTDCRHTASKGVWSDLVKDCPESGGFIAKLSDGCTANFKNCFLDLSEIRTTEGKDLYGDPIDDRTSEVFAYQDSKASTTITTDHCYYRLNDIYSPYLTTTTPDAIKATDEDLKNGSIAYALKAGRTGDDAKWTQTIGTDKVPQLALFSADSKEVFLATDTVKIGSAGWSTHYYPVAKELPDGVKAYTLSGVVKASESSANPDYIVQLAEVTDSIPAYTPVLLCTLADGATETDKTITIEMPDHYYNELGAMRNTSLDGSQQYWLIGATRSYKSFNGCYVLQQQTDAKGQKRTAFYRVNENVATPTVPAWKCVLMDFDVTGGEGASNAKAIHLRLDDDETTVIGAVQAIGGILTEGQTYDLQGRKVQTLQKGQVYIKNGQKFIVR